MKKILTITLIAILSIFASYSTNVLATSTTYVSLSDNAITVNGEGISTDTAEAIYLSNSMNNGGSSTEALEANEKVANVITITKSGTYEFTGTLSEGQIAVNTNNITGEVVIVLNNANITCENAPAIFVYGKDTSATNCTVTIKTSNGSSNTITGARIKQSVEGWADQAELVYYVEKGYDDENVYYERYKYDAAISSDISLTFEGEGTLTVNSTEKEGIETKRDITINSGNYVINSMDDGMNAAADGQSVITINGGTILIALKDEAEEGDGIDSNGSLIINGGKVYAFASEVSQDSGLDSDLGISINGGYVVGIGNMADAISSDSKQNYMQVQFTSSVSAGTLIAFTDQDKNPVAAFESNRAYSVITISTPEFKGNDYVAYEGGQIVGTSENGLYTEITSYEGGTVKDFADAANKEMGSMMNNMAIPNMEADYTVYYACLIALGVLLVVAIVIVVIFKKRGTILILVIGMLIGAILATSGFLVYNYLTQNNVSEQIMNGDFENRGMQRGEMPGGQMPEGQMPNGGAGMQQPFNSNNIQQM